METLENAGLLSKDRLLAVDIPLGLIVEDRGGEDLGETVEVDEESWLFDPVVNLVHQECGMLGQ